MRHRWRVACPGSPPWDRAPREAPRLADATAAAESFLLVGSDMGDVVVVFRDQPGKVPEWVPEVVGVRSGGSVTWHPWPPGWLPGTGLAVPAEAGADTELAAGRDGIGGVIAGERGGSIVAVSVDPGKPSMVAKIAARNAELFAAEAAGQAIPDEAISAIPLTAAPAPAAIEAPSPAGAAQSAQGQASAS